MLNELELERDCNKYSYLNNLVNESEILDCNDKNNYDLMYNALIACDFTEDDQIVICHKSL